MQTAGAMVCDSHHVPSTGLEALVVVSRCGHRRTCRNWYLFSYLRSHRDVVTIGIGREVRCDLSQHRDQFEVSATGA